MVSLTAVVPRFGPVLVPLSIVVAALAGLTWADTPIPGELVRLGPVLAMALAFVLALYFRLSNVAMIIVIVVAGLFLVTADESLLPPVLADTAVRTALVSVLLPINLVLFTMLPDRGLVTVSGLLRMTFVVLQVAGAILAVMAWPELVGGTSPLGGRTLPVGLPATPLPIIGVAVFGGAILVLATLAVKRSTPLEAGIMVLAVAVLAALHLQDQPEASSVMVVAAGAALAVTLLQNGYRLAFVDELTNLPGRRALEMEMHRLAGRYVVAMLDIDHFKSFNDTYGHDIGDEALRMVASHIRLVGGGGKPFRYGGEEFTVLFPGQTLDEAAEWLEDLRADVEGTPFRVREPGSRTKEGKSGKRRRGRARRSKSLTITISIGLADRNDRHKTPDQVIKAADKALYRAKEKGRNQVSK